MAVWPNCAAKCMHEKPSESLKVGSAPALISTTTVERWPCLHEFIFFQAFICKLFYAIKYETILMSFGLSKDIDTRWGTDRVAQCNGVEANSPPIASTTAPFPIRYLTISLRLFIAAQCNSVTVSESGWFTSAPASTNSVTRSNAPYCKRNVPFSFKI